MKNHNIENCKINHGVKTEIRLEDWRAGANSMIPFETRLLGGDWRLYLPPGEWQRDNDTDTFACVTFAHCNSVETQLNNFLYEGKLTDKKLYQCIKFNYISAKNPDITVTFEAVKNKPQDFSFNFSDRCLAKFSGTTREGNFLWKVGDAVRKIGLVAESTYPTPKSFTWEEYYAEIPSTIKEQCGKFLELFDVAYEFLTPTRENLLKHIIHAPLGIVLPGHMVLMCYTQKDVITYFDSYEPWLKQLVGLPQTAYKLVVTIKPDDMSDFLRTFRIEGKPEVFAILQNKRYWIAPYQFYTDGRGVLWADVHPANLPEIKESEAAKFPLAGLMGSTSVVDYIRAFFLK